ncbi:MAG: HlyD family secretion protein [Pseudoalteromonas sp.]|uniref:HlyD family secretion protein n=1 Tax=Pseudoalteromonas sp. TaxID=53249 RepID=UPI0025EAB177|nr:HlyD family efflux transporter periplasmic adaptor subunit [Pseudoalteromonas sp.]MCH2087144.1 HlyD family secretion protein [Pseudoalteromonas sp.]
MVISATRKTKQSPTFVEFIDNNEVNLKRVWGNKYRVFKTIILALVISVIPILLFYQIKETAVLTDARLATSVPDFIYYAPEELNSYQLEVEDGSIINKGDIVANLSSNVLQAKLESNIATLALGEELISSLESQKQLLKDELGTSEIIHEKEHKLLSREIEENKILLENVQNHLASLLDLRRRESEILEGVKNSVQNSNVSESYYNRIKERVIRYNVNVSDTEKEINALKNTIERLELEHLYSVKSMQQLGSIRIKINNIENEISKTRNTNATLKIEQESLNLVIDGLVVKAPFSGMLLNNFDEELGNIIPKGQRVLEIVPQENVFYTIGKIQESDLKYVKSGQKVQITLDAYTYLDYGYITGSVQKTKSVMDGFVETQIKIEHFSPEMNLAPGLSVNAEIITNTVPVYYYLYKKLLY